MGKDDLGIRVELLMPTQTNMNEIIKKIKEHFKGKITTDVNLVFTKKSINDKIIEIKNQIAKNPINIPVLLNINQGAINAQIQGLQNQVQKTVTQTQNKINSTIAGSGNTVAITNNGKASTQDIANFMNTIQNSLKNGSSIIKHQYDEFGKLNVQIRNGANEVKNLVFQYDKLKGSFIQTNKITQVPDLLNQTNQLARQLPEVKRIYDQFNVIKQNAGAGSINWDTARLRTDLEYLYTRTKLLNNGMQQITQTFKLNDKQTLSVAANYNMLTKSLSNVTESTGNLLNRQLGLGEMFKVAMERFPIWIATAEIVMGLIHKVTESFQYMKEMNSLFTNLRMEMTESSLNFNEITSAAINMANQFGTTSSEIMKAISIFGTFNSTLDQTIMRTKSAILLSNISGRSILEVSDDLMAAQTQFKLSADELEGVVNTYSAVSRNLLVDFPKALGEISNGMKYVGSVAVEAQMPYQELAATIGTLIETTRLSGSQVSFLK